MIRDFRKYWILWKLRKESFDNSSGHTLEVLQSNNKVWFARDRFVAHISEESLTRFSTILIWRKRDRALKLKKRITQYQLIIDSCIKEGFIELPNEIPGDNTFNEPIKKWQHLRIHSSGDELLGFFPILQGLLSKYYLAWTVIVIPFIVGIYSSPYLKHVIDLVREKFHW